MDLGNIAAMMTTTELMMTDEVWGEGSPRSLFHFFNVLFPSSVLASETLGR